MRLRINELNFSYGTKKVINNLSFSVPSGSFVSIIGKNGSGKSTLIKCILKTLKIPNEKIFLDDIDINNIQHFSNIGYVSQKVDFNYEFPITVKEILKSSYSGKVYDTYFKDTISSLDLNKLYDENINNLSGGQLQRIFIARALLTKPKLLILDEPTVGIDIENLKNLYSILSNLKNKEVTIVLITHDVDFCTDLTDYRLTLKENGDYEFIEVNGECNE